ncbi:hypothetical protein [Pseudomonas sp. BMS12]|uniref:hypothetical protein n=1 Tax=Pseudomonas sp. BMS12 TaxID=1796033 RepID=UPI00129083F0|nr:hypothetical protein [Pseudomonas sp. BMS12]
MTSINRYTAELNGYLNAISDFNDQVGYRHDYFAGHKKLLTDDPAAYIRKKFGEQAFCNLKESNLRQEANLIKSYALCNVENAELLDSKTRQPKLTETIVWRIQEYLSFYSYRSEQIKTRWISKFSDRGFSCESIFIATSNYLVWVVFSKRHDEIPADQA